MLAAAWVSAPALAGPPCCDQAKAKDGWYTGHEMGFAYGVPLKGKALYEALTAKPAGELKCEGCKKAAETNGWCSHCKVAVAHGKLYRSPYAHAIALGNKLDPTGIKCPQCAKTAKAGEHGWCEGCQAGLVAGYGFKSKEDYDRAVKAFQIIKTAAASKCEACAVGMVTDGKCDHCKVTFKDGKKVALKENKPHQ